MCGLCQESVCKNCAQFLDEESFSFLMKRPEALSYTTYCPSCFDQNVAPELERYNQDIERAKEIAVYDKSQSKETRNFKRYDVTYTVQECADREETLLRLAFQAVRGGFNALIEVDITSKKVRNQAYQKQIYSGTASPAKVSEGKRWK